MLCRVEKTDEGKTNVQFPGQVPHLKLDQLSSNIALIEKYHTFLHYLNAQRCMFLLLFFLLHDGITAKLALSGNPEWGIREAARAHVLVLACKAG